MLKFQEPTIVADGKKILSTVTMNGLQILKILQYTCSVIALIVLVNKIVQSEGIDIGLRKMRWLFVFLWACISNKA